MRRRFAFARWSAAVAVVVVSVVACVVATATPGRAQTAGADRYTIANWPYDWSLTTVAGVPLGAVSITADAAGNAWTVNAATAGGYRTTPEGAQTFYLAYADGPLVLGADGVDHWYETYYPSTLVHLDTAGVSHTVATLPAGFPGSLATGSDGNVWRLYDRADDQSVERFLDRITPAGSVTTFSVGNRNANGLVAGGDGNLWFHSSSGPEGEAIGRVTLAGDLTIFPTGGIPAGRLLPGPDDTIWFAVDTATGAFQRIDTAGAISAGSQPALIGAAPIEPARSGGLLVGHEDDVVHLGPAGIDRTVALPGRPGVVTDAPGGVIWTEVRGALVRIAADGTTAAHGVPDVRDPFAATRGADGNIWFGNRTKPGAHDAATLADDSIGRVTEAGALSTFTAPGLALRDLVTGPDGNVWFTDAGTNQVGRVTPGGAIARFAHASIDAPDHLVVGTDGALWFTNAHSIGRVTTAGAVTSFASGVGTPTSLATATDGNVWFTDDASNAVVRLSPAGQATPFTAAGLSHPRSLVRGADANLWFVASDAKVGRITPAGTITLFDPPTLWLPDIGPVVGDLRDVRLSPQGHLWVRIHTGADLGALGMDGAPVDGTAEGPPGTPGLHGTTWYTHENGVQVRGPSSMPPAVVYPGGGRVTAVWTAPRTANADAVTSYTVTATPGGKTCTTTTTSCAVEGLTPGTRYSLRVVASNGPGDSLPTAPSGFATPYRFADVPTGAPFFGEIEWLAQRGITTGYPDGTFHPNGSVERQAMAAFLYRFAGSPNGPSPACSEPPFTDVKVGAPFCGEIAWLKGTGITTGHPDGTFHPTEPVDRRSMAAFLYRFARRWQVPIPPPTPCEEPPFTDVAVGAPFCGEIAWMELYHITTGHPDGSYHPVEPVSRMAMAAFLLRLDTAISDN